MAWLGAFASRYQFGERSTLVKIYVGNLSFRTTDDELRQEFEAFGTVESATIVRDKYSGQPRGFGFVEMSTRAEAQAAIEGLKGKVLDERTLDVSEARPRPDSGRGGRTFGGGRRGGSGGGGGRGKGRRY
jgi:cold-inducible RNA-binding protein